MPLAQWPLHEGVWAGGGLARLSLWSLLARQTCRQALALPWLLGGMWTPCTAWAAVLVSHPGGETCSSASQRTASHLAFSLASVAGSAGLLCRGGIYPDSEKGAVPYKPTSPLQRSFKGLQGFLKGRGTVHGQGVAGCDQALHPSVLASFPRALLPSTLHWLIDFWQLRGTVAQDERVQRRLLGTVKEEGLRNQ